MGSDGCTNHTENLGPGSCMGAGQPAESWQAATGPSVCMSTGQEMTGPDSWQGGPLGPGGCIHPNPPNAAIDPGGCMDGRQNIDSSPDAAAGPDSGMAGNISPDGCIGQGTGPGSCMGGGPGGSMPCGPGSCMGQEPATGSGECTAGGHGSDSWQRPSVESPNSMGCGQGSGSCSVEPSIKKGCGGNAAGGKRPGAAMGSDSWTDKGFVGWKGAAMAPDNWTGVGKGPGSWTGAFWGKGKFQSWPATPSEFIAWHRGPDGPDPKKPRHSM